MHLTGQSSGKIKILLWNKIFTYEETLYGSIEVVSLSLKLFCYSKETLLCHPSPHLSVNKLLSTPGSIFHALILLFMYHQFDASVSNCWWICLCKGHKGCEGIAVGTNFDFMAITSILSSPSWSPCNKAEWVWQIYLEIYASKYM